MLLLAVAQGVELPGGDARRQDHRLVRGSGGSGGLILALSWLVLELG